MYITTRTALRRAAKYAAAAFVITLFFSVNIVSAQVCTDIVNVSASYKVKDSVAYGGGIYTVGTTYGVGGVGWRIERRDQTGVVSWSQTEQPSTYADEAFDIAVDSSGIYIVGYESVSSSVTRWRIEKRDLATGAFVSAFDTDGVISGVQGSGAQTYAWGVAVSGSSLYVVGQDDLLGNSEWRIEKRDATTGALIGGFGISGVVTNNPSSNNEGASGVAVDGTGIYVVGTDQLTAGDIRWRTEKRNLSTGALVSGFGASGVLTSNPTAGNDSAFRAAIDSSGLYIFGFDSNAGSEWRTEKRDLTTGASLWAQVGSGSGSNNIAIDSTGIYLAGTKDSAFYAEKRNLSTGAVLWNQTSDPTANVDEAWSVAVDSTALYLGGNQYDTATNNGWMSLWRVEKRNLVTGTAVTQCTGSSYVDIGLRVKEAGVSMPTAIAIESNTATNAGYDFGGIYGSKAGEENPLTGGFSCPSGVGYTSVQLQKSFPRLNSSIYYCYRPSSTSGGAEADFGGLFVQSSNSTHTYTNPLTGAMSCPSGYTTSSTYGSLSTSAGFVPAYTLRYCYKDVTSLADSARLQNDFGGMNNSMECTGPQVAACGLGGTNPLIVNNPLTGGQSCPSGFTKTAMHTPSLYYDPSESTVADIDIGYCTNASSAASPLRISKNGTMYGVALVDPSDPAATSIRIKVAGAIKALRKFVDSVVNFPDKSATAIGSCVGGNMQFQATISISNTWSVSSDFVRTSIHPLGSESAPSSFSVAANSTLARGGFGSLNAPNCDYVLPNPPYGSGSGYADYNVLQGGSVVDTVRYSWDYAI